MESISEYHKITNDHLAKIAFIYVRQSSLKQVQRNTGSTARQYDLSTRALELGWQHEQLVIIDQDQALSGSSSTERMGFQRIVAEVSLGHAGAVLSLEASRLARSSSDWYRLLEICALTHTLVIDEEGIYDPSQYNDRLLLGFKGTMSEAELHWIRSRLIGGKMELARQGNLRFHPPTGYIYDVTNRLIKDPNEAIQASIQRIFESFSVHRSARGVMLDFKQHDTLIPTRLWGTARAGECIWKPLTARRTLDILHNPFYAGTYVYGQTQIVAHLNPDGTISRQQIDRDEPLVTLHDHHEGYISWDEFQRNQHQLEDNRNGYNRNRRGVPREGAGLLQGIVLCGKCGRRMKVRYQEDQIRPTYACDGVYQSGGDPWCQAIRGHHIDDIITQTVLSAMQPAEIEVALQAVQQLQYHHSQLQRQQQLQLEHLQYEADLARRRFIAVEPENRLVARTLERDWNDKLNQVDELQRTYAQSSPMPTTHLDDEQRTQILQLVQDFPALWHSSTTTHADRKQLIRYLIKDVTLLGKETTVQIGIRWQSDAITDLEIPRGTLRTADHIIHYIRDLATRHYSDEMIAQALNEKGWTTARRHSFSANRVKELRVNFHIFRGDALRPDAYPTGQRSDGLYTVRKTSEMLNWSISTIHKWCRQGILSSVQEKPNASVWIQITPEQIATLRNPNNPWDPNKV
ncbi:MAG: recombinase family protein [Phototrophicaceae bacterium]